MHIPWWQANRGVRVGIDIDTNTIKLVVLKKKNDSSEAFELINYARVTTTPEFPSIHMAVQNALQQVSIGKKNKIIVALPYGQVISKIICLPATKNADELEAKIISHCTKIITYSIHEACIDFEVIKNKEKRNIFQEKLPWYKRRKNQEKYAEMECEVRVVVARRSAVEGKINLFIPHFSVAAIDVESDALARSINYVLSHEKKSSNSVVAKKIITAIHIATQKILGIVLYQEEIVFAQEMIINVTDPTGISIDDYIEKLKLLLPMVDLFTNELKSKHGLSFIADRVYLSGNYFSNELFRSKIEHMANRRSCLINPFVNMEVSNKIQDRDADKDVANLTIASGLAMRSFSNEY